MQIIHFLCSQYIYKTHADKTYTKKRKEKKRKGNISPSIDEEEGN